MNRLDANRRALLWVPLPGVTGIGHHHGARKEPPRGGTFVVSTPAGERFSGNGSRVMLDPVRPTATQCYWLNVGNELLSISSVYKRRELEGR
jgi:hypothetical protein